MKVFVPGATGVLGHATVPVLVRQGHEVVGVTRDDTGARWLEDAGAGAVEVDLFDPGALGPALSGCEAVVNLATAMPPLARMGRREAWRLNDRLRSEGVANLVAAAIGAGAGVFVQPTVTFNYAPGGARWLDEDAPLDPPFAATESALVAEETVAGFTGGAGVVLRLSRLYGPGRASAELVETLRRGRGVVVGSGDNYTSNLHVADAGTALAAALGVPAGIYNVTDDEPVTALQWMSTLAEAVGASPPRRVPAWLARPLIGGGAVRLLTVSQRVSNARFRDRTGWSCAYPTLADGARTLP